MLGHGDGLTVYRGLCYRSTVRSGSLHAGGTRVTYNQKLQPVARRATAVFADKGYHRALIRDVVWATGVRLSGFPC